MATVRPFKAVRPKKDIADRVCSLPYDVMNRIEAKKMVIDNPFSFLHITRSEIDLSDNVDAYDKSVYAKAHDNLVKFMNDGILFKDSEPFFYIYEQRLGNVSQTGIVSTVSVKEYDSNVIKKHEFTRKEKEQDRIEHFFQTRANTEPVFLTFKKASDEIVEIIDSFKTNNEKEYDFSVNDTYGNEIRHMLWVIRDSGIIKRIVEYFHGVDSLYIADGHHRSASAANVSKKLKDLGSLFSDKGYNDECDYFMAVVFPSDELHIYDYNRVVKDLNKMSIDAFLLRIKKSFDVEKIGNTSPYSPRKKHEFGMFLGDNWYRLNVKNTVLDALSGNKIGLLDVSILQNEILDPVLGIKDPRTDKRIDFVGGIRGLRELEERVREDAKVAFSMYPVEMNDIIEISDSGMVMPPKSTWFEPKLGSGLFVHLLDE